MERFSLVTFDPYSAVCGIVVMYRCGLVMRCVVQLERAYDMH
jgi:hypothetical protein